MAYITVDLSETTLPPGGNVRNAVDYIIPRLMDLGCKELDSHYGPEDWCLHLKVYALPGPYPNITICLEVNDDSNYTELSARVNATFKKHWATAISEAYSKMG